MWDFLLLGCEVTHSLICIILAKQLSTLFSSHKHLATNKSSNQIYQIYIPSQKWHRWGYTNHILLTFHRSFTSSIDEINNSLLSLHADPGPLLSPTAIAAKHGRKMNPSRGMRIIWVALKRRKWHLIHFMMETMHGHGLQLDTLLQLAMELFEGFLMICFPQNLLAIQKGNTCTEIIWSITSTLMWVT